MSDSYPHFWEAAWHLALESRDFANPYNTSQLARLFHKIGLLNVGKRQAFRQGTPRRLLLSAAFLAGTCVGGTCADLISPRGTRDGWLPVSQAFVCVPGGSALSPDDRRGAHPPPAAHEQCSYSIRRADPPSRLVGPSLPHEGPHFSRLRAPVLSPSRFGCHR